MSIENNENSNDNIDKADYSEDINFENKDKTLESIENYIKVVNNKQEIQFDFAYPGKIDEMDLSIENISDTFSTILRVKVICLNEEFDDLEEYVYSMRKIYNNYNNNNLEIDYNDTFLIKMEPKNRLDLKIAIKVPNLKKDKIIKGMIEIVSSNLNNNILIPINTKNWIPEVKLEKMMYDNIWKISALKILMKNRYLLDYRALIKSNFPEEIKIEYDIIPDNNIKHIYDFNILNKISILNKFQSNLVIFSIKLKQNVKNLDFKKLNELKFLLIAKVRNSSIIYGYPILCQIVEDNDTIL